MISSPLACCSPSVLSQRSAKELLEHRGRASAPCPLCRVEYTAEDIIPIDLYAFESKEGADNGSAMIDMSAGCETTSLVSFAGVHGVAASKTLRSARTAAAAASAEAVSLPAAFCSSKVARFVQILSKLRREDPNVKVVVFSQWLPLLSALERVLALLNVKTYRLDGGLEVRRRSEVRTTRPTVLVQSLFFAARPHPCFK